ncbi:uncharacterized protein LOC132309704 [Cornus florida]|uniref:uncharacterized protein LOC132309704 n=1 Tax=Cornus florida TaxID=4283 RepID=UPI00289A1FD9|nr:uncharacterized protein LOC132309704 [Cornus florida]
MNLGEIIKEENNASLQDRAKTMIFLRHHLHEELKTEYLTDFKSISEYNSALFKISSQLKLCGEKITDDDMLEKTYSTFHASNVLLQQQYREHRFTKYSELLSCLLVDDQNNELLMQNHQSRPTGSVPFPEANVSSFHSHGRGRGHGCRGGRGYGRNRNNYSNRGGHNSSLTPRRNSTPSHQKWNSNTTKQAKEKALQNKAPKIYDDKPCSRCGMKGHWSRTCHTPKHLVDLYRASMNDKGKGKEIEINFVDDDLPTDITHFDVSDFFADTSGSVDHLIGDGNVHTN